MVASYLRVAGVLVALAVVQAAGCGGVASSGGDAGAGGSCDDLAAQYATALGSASACTVGASGQCGVLASSSLSPCSLDCMTFVQDTTTLDGLKARWMAAGCADKIVACPAIACLSPTAGTCAAGDGGGGRCVSAAFTTN